MKESRGDYQLGRETSLRLPAWEGRHRSDYQLGRETSLRLPAWEGDIAQTTSLGRERSLRLPAWEGRHRSDYLAASSNRTVIRTHSETTPLIVVPGLTVQENIKYCQIRVMLYMWIIVT